MMITRVEISSKRWKIQTTFEFRVHLSNENSKGRGYKDRCIEVSPIFQMKKNVGSLSVSGNEWLDEISKKYNIPIGDIPYTR